MRAVLAATAVLSGCAATILHMYNPPYNYEPSEEDVVRPEVGQLHEAAAGAEILRQSKQRTRETIYLAAEQHVSIWQLAPGYYKKIGSDVQGEYFLVAGGSDTGHITSPTGGPPPLALFVQKSTGILCGIDPTQQANCSRPKAQVTFASADGYERRKRVEGADTTAMQALIYGGRDGSRITLTYLRTSDSAPTTARVEHDLNASPVISYGGARIEVIEATPSAIKYRVLQGFQEPRLTSGAPGSPGPALVPAK